MPITRKLLAWVLISFCLAGLLSACSSSRLGYQNLPWLVSWKSRDYVPLTREQRAWLREQVALQRDWHCQQELPGYADLLDQLATPVLNGNPSADSLLDSRNQLEPALDRLLTQLAPTLADLLQQLEEDQIAALQQNLHKQQQELYDTYVAPDDATQANERQERLERRLRPWLGRLQSEQQERIADWSARLSGQNAVWLDNRRYWLDAFTAALDARDKPDFAAQIERLLTDRESYWTDSFRERTEINSQLAAHMLSDVMALNSTSQNARLRQRLDRLQADIERIDCSNNI